MTVFAAELCDPPPVFPAPLMGLTFWPPDAPLLVPPAPPPVVPPVEPAIAPAAGLPDPAAP